MTNTFPDYERFPREYSVSCQPMDEALDKLRSEFSKTFNAWLEKCVKEFCPEAMEAYRNGDTIRAVAILGTRDFYYVCLPGDVFEFRKGETLLARCKIELTIKSDLIEQT